MTTTENRFEELAFVQVGRCMSPDGGLNVSFNGGFENKSPYYKGDVNHDTGETCLREVGVFAGWQRREQDFNHIERRFDFFCMVERAMKKLDVYLKETKEGRGLHIFIVLLW